MPSSTPLERPEPGAAGSEEEAARLERLLVALEVGETGVWEWDVASGRVVWTATTYAVHGRAPGDFEGTVEGFLRLVHPEDLPRIQEAIGRALDEGAPYDIEYRDLRPGGGVHWTRARARVLRAPDGRPVRMIGVCWDVTERRRRERAMRFLASASATLAVAVDTDETLRRVARLAIPDYADWCVVDLVEDGALRRVATAHADPDKVRLVEELAQRYAPPPGSPHGPPRVLRTGEPELVPRIPDELLQASALDEEHLRILRSLELRSYLCVPMRARDRIVGVLTFVNAESGYEYREDDLALAQDLASRAAVAIENARLYDALRLSDRRKDEFLAVLGHELRNPLSAVRNAILLLGMDLPPERAAELRGMLEHQVGHLGRLVDDLLDLSRIVHGRIELRRAPVDVADAIERGLETARPLLDERRHEVAVHTPDEPLVIEADLVRVAQTVSNLLLNAARYTDPGGSVEVAAERDGDHARIEVRDTGRGLAPERLQTVFEPFSREDGADAGGGGLGIGLTLVRSLVELHGGTVEAQSPGRGRGSTFVVRLPLAEAAARPPAGPGAVPAAEGTACRVLLVDDHVEGARALALLLRTAWGHEVEVAHDAASGLAAAGRFRPDVALLDIGLPDLSGRELARRLRARPEHRGTMLVAITGYGQPSDRERSLAAGFDLHLVKPVATDVLQELFARASARRVADG